jgi:peptidoglycan L-alanyl-D-glutamate endopeptidase CwlK
MNSRHLTGHAVDIVPWINRTIPWNDWQIFTLVAQAMKQAAQDLNIPLVWGGDWKTFRDGPHFELSREAYP